jgi:hypothetical protein
MPDWRKIERLFNYFGFFLLLVFPIGIVVPGFGFVVETMALASAMLFAYRGRRILLTLGAIGSMLVTSQIFGYDFLWIGVWGMIIVSGAAFGEMIASGFLPWRAFVISAAIISVFVLFLYWGERGQIAASLDGFESWIKAALIQEGAVSGSANQTVEWVTRSIGAVKRLMPSLLALSATAQLFAAAAALFLYIKESGEYIRTFGSFIYWKMPFAVVYPTGLFVLLRLVGTAEMEIVADNVLLFIGIFYSIFGFSAIEYFLRRLRLTLFLRALFYIGLLFMQLPGLIIAAGIGFFDSRYDFRKIKARAIG